MLSLSVYNFSNNQLGVSLTSYKDNNGGIWFVGNEVARALGYRNPKRAVQRHVRVRNTAEAYEISRGTETEPLDLDPRYVKKLIKESEVYRLTLKCNSTIAEEFQDWICEEVIPNIRTQGFYALPGALRCIHAIDDGEISSLSDDDRKEFREISQQKSDLAKNDSAVRRGHVGGSVTQQRRRDMIQEVKRLVESESEYCDKIWELEEENAELRTTIDALTEYIEVGDDIEFDEVDNDPENVPLPPENNEVQ